MKKQLKSFVKDVLKKRGYSLKKNTPLIFDIGVNHGQTLKKIKEIFPQSEIHGFEPSKKCFNQLKENFITKDIILNNLAVGDKEEMLEFNEYSWDALNSLLERAFTKSTIVEKYDVPVTTIDKYCEENQIDGIDFLKTDTEGFELKVLQGASEKMKMNKIQFIHVELFFDLNFIGQSSVGDIFNFLEANDFSLVRFYDFSFNKNGIASKSDALFYNKKFGQETI